MRGENEKLITALADRLWERIEPKLHDFGRKPRVTARLFTVREAAIYLGRSEAAIQHLIFKKALPVIRRGRRIHLDRYALDQWIAQKHRPGQP